MDTKKFSNYENLKVLGKGAYGTVISAVDKTSQKEVAMKFFGYTKKIPRLADIKKEIGLMDALTKQGTIGITYLIGTFDDSPEGYRLVDKEYPEPYPVIVMEKLTGGNMFQRIKNRKEGDVNEEYLAASFKSFMTALASIHEKGYIHRDLKLDNIVSVSPDESSDMKIIDFGHMVSLPPEKVGLVQRATLCGTDGYFAPETLERCEYSVKTDVWQAGCILYTMLAGHPPYHCKKHARFDPLRYPYFPMEGKSWRDISEEAKDLVRRMLEKAPSQRISVEEVLQHDWLRSTRQEIFPEAYKTKIKLLALAARLRLQFKKYKIENEYEYHKTTFMNLLPFSQPSNTPSLCLLDDEDFAKKLMALKDTIVDAFGVRCAEGGSGAFVDEESHRPTKRRRNNGALRYMDFSKFCEFVRSSDLEILARLEVFNVFDANGDQQVDLKEFLVALLALKPNAAASEHEKIQAAELYFQVFDLDGNGFIGVDELEVVVNCLLQDGTCPHLGGDCDGVTLKSIQDVFDAIDTSKDGKIDFKEFRDFFQVILTSSSSITSSSTNSQKNGDNTASSNSSVGNFDKRMLNQLNLRDVAVVPPSSEAFSFLQKSLVRQDT